MGTEQPAIDGQKRYRRLWFEIFIVLACAVVVFIWAGHYDILERIIEFSQRYEKYEIDELFTVSVFLVIALSAFLARHLHEATLLNRIIEQKNSELVEALAHIKKLDSFIPICSSCKKIRDDEGYWQRLEAYIHEHTGSKFSHGLCPGCRKKLYPEFAEEKEEESS